MDDQRADREVGLGVMVGHLAYWFALVAAYGTVAFMLYHAYYDGSTEGLAVAFLYAGFASALTPSLRRRRK